MILIIGTFAGLGYLKFYELLHGDPSTYILILSYGLSIASAMIILGAYYDIKDHK